MALGMSLHTPLHATLVQSASDGNWSTATTWSTGMVPSETDSVIVTHLVALDQTLTVSGYLKVDVGATLHKSGNSQDIYLTAGAVIDDYGSIICRNLSNSGVVNVYNGGFTQYYLQATNNFDNNTGGVVNNWGWIEIHTLNNLVGGVIYNNTPVGTISITNKLDNSGLIDNDWIVSITGNLINNQGTLSGDGGTYLCDPTFTNNAGATVDCSGAPINICRPNGTYPVVNGSGDVNTSCVLLCNGPWPPVLAVDLVAFTAIANSTGDVVLNWTSATEVNALRYDVERSSNGSDFTWVGSQEAARISSEPRTYRTIDAAAPSGKLLYRLKMHDFNGSYTYSSIIGVTIPAQENVLTIYPNPSSTTINIVTESTIQGESSVLFRQLQGSLVKSIPVKVVEGSMNLQADLTHLPNGTYIVEYFNGMERKFGRLVVLH